MVTRILFDPRVDLPDGTTTSAPVIVEATPTGIRANGAVFTLPTTLSFTVNTAADQILLDAPAVSWGWNLAVRRLEPARYGIAQAGSILTQRTVTWTDAATITWANLTDLDPATLEPTTSTIAAWTATQALAQQALDAVNALKAGAPGALDTFLELATQLTADESGAAALATLIGNETAARQAFATSLPATYATLAQQLLGWGYAQSYRVVSATRDANEAITTASVVWPDGATGTFTTDTVSTSFPGAIDAYHVTHVLAGTTLTVTQTAVTRDAGGAVTAQPALTVA